MNSKRQTVWLVSMLSLMVILSAYYLFTEDVNPSSNLLTDGTQQEQQLQDGATEVTADGAKEEGIVVDKVEQADGTATAEAGTTAEAEQADQETLEQIEAQGLASNAFDELQYKRDQKNAAENDRLMSALSAQDEETATKAVDELAQLEDKTAKMTSLEEELGKEFKTVLITPQAGNKYKVVVQSEKLDKSQADSIIIRVMDELGLKAEQVSVQFIS
ncbi:stage III sporulation protein AH [Paenibacillus phyllosphaerae]|uniref:Stage III sporulation protein AH n=1 Tax=Paenibacillus phyllosphaerae TaxID=274593 RepID=A0A7W5AW03_9BACL|nr:SpoIIIAH-like family protein [Paenibacillus phyllosphaerae]MBB3109176.1 stage III sporulation protein AH [Paenibacillus phyllosphaerae]